MEIDDIIVHGARKLDLIMYGRSGADDYDIHITFGADGFSCIKSCTVISYDPKFKEYLQYKSQRYIKYGGHIDPR
jgi:hypothetical protein